jgi:hypothetical protein
MRQFLGNEHEEKQRKGELRSILTATMYGLLFGGLIGAVLAGYDGMLVGMFAGAPLMSLFSILGVRAERLQQLRAQAKAQSSPPPTTAIVRRRRSGQGQ